MRNRPAAADVVLLGFVAILVGTVTWLVFAGVILTLRGTP